MRKYATSVFEQSYAANFKPLTDNLFRAFEIALIALIVPTKTFLFSVHNYLTQRDYTYSIDDACDILLLGTVSFWIYTFVAW